MAEDSRERDSVGNMLRVHENEWRDSVLVSGLGVSRGVGLLVRVFVADTDGEIKDAVPESVVVRVGDGDRETLRNRLPVPVLEDGVGLGLRVGVSDCVNDDGSVSDGVLVGDALGVRVTLPDGGVLDWVRTPLVEGDEV